ncbi:MAG: hypothetical protein DYG94_00875 [Leptolyngbya sp. PLA3]|nr:MAG: hypothetical protein EDM82_01000 [Cyanobacteria bacterium CYA]MCE7967286.1 hypothetical protein [Leptolyngbya sp. PL-A3]
MHRFCLCSALIVSAGSAVMVSAQVAPEPVQPDPRIRVDGHQLVEVRVNTQEQLDAVVALADTVWSERVGLGLLDVQFPPEALAELPRLGIAHRVLHNNVQALIDAEWAEIQRRNQQRDISWYQNYHNYANVITYLNTLAAAHPDLAVVESAGTSIESRDIPAIRITGPGDSSQRPVVFLNGTQHAREWVSTKVVMYIAESLLNAYGSDSRVTDLLDECEVIIVPIVNPDGFVYTWTNYRLWRKNRRGGYGVDLNRNWDWHWGGLGSDGSTSSDVYRGTAPFSEPETDAIRDYVVADGRVVAAIDYHSYSQLILWPWSYDYVDPPADDLARFTAVGLQMRQEMLNAGGEPYTAQSSYELYAAAGVASDWFYGALDALSYTIELRDTGLYGFELPASQILPTCQENWPAFLYFAEQAIRPITISLPAGAPTTASTAATTPFQVLITDAASSYAAGTGQLHVRVGNGSFTSSDLTSLGGGLFQASLPSASCGTDIDYYLTANSTDGRTVTLPSGGASTPFTAEAVDLTVAFDDTMESGTNGWTAGIAGDTATTGQWQRADPQGTAAQPENDHTNPGTMCWVTGPLAGTSIGTYDVDNGVTILVSPTFDASGAASGDLDAFVSYWRWYSNDQGASPNEDSMPVEISNNNGSTWTQLELVTDNAGAWTYREFNVADFVTPTAQMKLRFIARDIGSGSIVEAAVDDVRLEVRGCACYPADMNCDGTLDFFDVQIFLDAFAHQNSSADFNDDGVYDFFDVQIFLDLFSRG